MWILWCVIKKDNKTHFQPIIFSGKLSMKHFCFDWHVFIHISFTNKLIFLHWNKGYFQLPFQNENIWYGFLSCKQFMSIWAKSFYVCSSTSKQYCIILAILSFCKVNVEKIESRKSFYISFTKIRSFFHVRWSSSLKHAHILQKSCLTLKFLQTATSIQLYLLIRLQCMLFYA